ncbi:DUF3577 domain-containing protein [uncultured Pseudacidovorax sp.]|uniref:DUF3577 domain-containing protein n=1 Tax=uncultured Pseudacidovorax sp. TaxID=679313 RepID=UPI0025EC1177|nr:DUF3577 domain-containing protein [uncultured Pseudacidovorax sp.]
MNAQSNNASTYFNLHFSGIGYLNRVRWVETNRGGRKAVPFLSCAVNALHGSAEDPNFTYFDLKVSGTEAIEIISSLKGDVDQRRKVLVTFKGGDIYPHLYERQARDRQGNSLPTKEAAVLIKGRLLVIYTVKVDGVEVYRRPPAADAEAAGDTGVGEDAQLGAESDDAGLPAEPLEAQATSQVQQRRATQAAQPRAQQQAARQNRR